MITAVSSVHTECFSIVFCIILNKGDFFQFIR